ncbi:MAG: DapH/DapD/GlmU-related protein [Candidatus Woesearchaeota archaeon]
MSIRSRILPYYGKPGLIRSINTSSKIKKENKIVYLLKRIINHILLVLAYSIPINSIRIALHKMRGVKIGKDVFIGLHVIIDRSYPEYIELEDGVMLAGGNHLLAHSRAPEFYKGKLLSYVAPIKIKKYSWVGINAIILPGVTIGSGSVVSAGSVVSEDVPDNVLVRGNPATIIKKFE